MKLIGIVLAIAVVFTLGCAGGPAANGGGSTAAAAGSTIYSSDFEKDLGGFGPKGPVNVELSTDVAHSGTHSIKVSDRSQTWHAPELDITGMLTNKKGVFTVTCWFLVPKDSPVSAVKLTVQTTAGGANNWVQIAKPVAADPGKWVKLVGEYNKQDSFEAITVYVEPSDPEGTFYVDDFSIAGPAAQ